MKSIAAQYNNSLIPTHLLCDMHKYYVFTFINVKHKVE